MCLCVLCIMKRKYHHISISISPDFTKSRIFNFHLLCVASVTITIGINLSHWENIRHIKTFIRKLFQLFRKGGGGGRADKYSLLMKMHFPCSTNIRLVFQNNRFINLLVDEMRLGPPRLYIWPFVCSCIENTRWTIVNN